MSDEILIVEDNPNDVILMLRALDSLTNEKLICRDAEEALAYLNDAHEYPILILLDLGLPLMDGATFAYRVKHDPRTRAIPIVVITGSASDEARMFSLEAEAYLMKPLTIEGLVSVLPRLKLKWSIRHV